MLGASEVETVSYTDFVPLSTTAGPWNYVRVEGYTPAPGESLAVNRALVAPDYFATMRIPILEGRDFNARDDRKGEPVMIVNQAFARRYFHGAESRWDARSRVRRQIVQGGGAGEGQQVFQSRRKRRRRISTWRFSSSTTPARNSIF